jgi:hypothetical protein
MNSLAIISQVIANKSPRFVSLNYTSKGTGEIARHTIRIGASVENAYRKDLRTLEKELCSMRVALNDGHAWQGLSLSVAILACEEMISSLKESLDKGIGNNSAYTCKDVFVNIAKGIKVHKESGEVHLTGFGRSKVTLQEGTHKSVNSSEKTLAKKKLKKLLLSGKFKQFVLPNVESAKMNGLELIFG